MRIDNEIKLDYKDVLIRPKRSTLGSRKEVDLYREFNYRNSEHYEMSMNALRPEMPDYRGIPIMASNMDGVGTFEMADVLSKHGLFTCLVKTYSKEDLIKFFNSGKILRTEHCAYSMGISIEELTKFIEVYQHDREAIKYVCVDVANGYSNRFRDYIATLREKAPHIVIIAGNVVTGEMTEELILSGADIVKVGIGPGSVCTTRIQTGVGYPQLSAVIECADAAHGLGGHIIADGGCVSPGDVAKAFAAGADFVMLGGMLAGHDEGGGNVITESIISNVQAPATSAGIGKRIEKQFVEFYGMSSKSANDKHFGGLKDYRSSEGRTVVVPYKGPVLNTVQDILGGLRSACTYAGAEKLKNLSKCTTFVRCTQTHNQVYESSTIGV